MKTQGMRKIWLSWLLIAMFLLCMSTPAWADTWQWRNPLPQGNSLIGVAYGNGTFVAVGSGGTILTSTDGSGWTKRISGTDNLLQAVTYNNGIFVVVGDHGTILTSPDGESWTNRESGTNNSVSGVTYGSGNFVAVGENGAVLTSPDAENWTFGTSGSDCWLSGVIYGEGVFVAVGTGETILTSSDGNSWNTISSNAPNSVSGVTYGEGNFVVVGKNDLVLTSPDGSTWTSGHTGVLKTLFGITFYNGTFVGVGDEGTVLTSLDGINWTIRNTGISNRLNGIAHGNGIYTVVGEYGAILTSADGVNWDCITTGVFNSLSDILFSNGNFLAVGDSGAVLTSSDGISWISRNTGNSNWLSGIAYGNGTFVAVGDHGSISTSPDGTVWTPRTSGTTWWIKSVMYLNGAFVAVGDEGLILTSPDGMIWTKRGSGTSVALWGAAYGNGIYVAAGEDIVLSSPDGINWACRVSNIQNRIYDVAYGNETFTVVGNYGYILTSQDGVNWTTGSTGEVYTHLLGVKYINGNFWATGTGSSWGRVLTSPDGLSWTRCTMVSNNSLEGIAFGNNSCVVVGSGGTIIQSYLTGLSTDSAAYSLKVGESHSTEVTAIYNGQTNNVTANSTFQSSNWSVATVNPDGLVVGINAGQAVISAEYEGIKALVEVTVTAATPTGGGGGRTPPASVLVNNTNGQADVNPVEGGTVYLGSEASVNIPAGAIQGTDSVTVKVQKATSPPTAPAGFRLMGTCYELSIDGRRNINFDKPVSLTFNFDPASLAAGEKPAVYYYDESSTQWVKLGGTVSGNSITVSVEHFTKFAVLAVEEAAAQKNEILLTDIAGHWAEKSIEKMVALGAIKGYPDETFKPDSTITRAEFATALKKAFGLESNNPKVYTDTAGHWSKDYVGAAAACGVVSGYDNSRFGPDDPITREQMAVLVTKAAKLLAPTKKAVFTDSANISGWAGDAVSAAAENGIIKGYPDNTYGPNEIATRAEAVTVILNALE